MQRSNWHTGVDSGFRRQSLGRQTIGTLRIFNFGPFSGLTAACARTGKNRTLNLALQGGGAHGAFTWGVLDALLEDSSIDVEGVSGTSAGAMNALCLAHGLMTGGRDGARETLARFWTSVAASSPFASSGDGGAGLSPALKLMLQWTNHLSLSNSTPSTSTPCATSSASNSTLPACAAMPRSSCLSPPPRQFRQAASVPQP